MGGGQYKVRVTPYLLSLIAQHLHLTIAMLKLYSDEARHKARMLLKALQPELRALLAGQPLQVRLAYLAIAKIYYTHIPSKTA